MRVVYTIDAIPNSEIEPNQPLTRKALSKALKCHINTIYNDEAQAREQVETVKKYYEGGERWVDLNPHLIWVLLKIRSLCLKYKDRGMVEIYITAHQHEFTEEAFKEYVETIRETRSAVAA